MPNHTHVPAEKLARYRATLRRRTEQAERERQQRRERALRIVDRAAEVLKQEFGATEVLLFGSLLHPDWFSQTSDIDLAAWGLNDDYFRAVARLQDLSSEFDVDLVAMEQCSPSLQSSIIESGIPV